MEQERYLRSIEARLKLHDQLLQHLFVLAYGDSMDHFGAFLDSQEQGLLITPLSKTEAYSEESLELKVEIKMQLDQWGDRVVGLIQQLQDRRRARLQGQS